jgi:hypothetical protein
MCEECQFPLLWKRRKCNCGFCTERGLSESTTRESAPFPQRRSRRTCGIIFRFYMECISK